VGARSGTNISQGGTLFDQFRADVASGNLPQVSWIVAPEAYTEHPNWPLDYGAWYVSQMLDALTSNPEVWSKTAFFLMYDENDGFFDHVVPPTPPRSRSEGLSTIDLTNELFAGNSTYAAGPYGLGVRVPMIVISPWSKGGWVNSEVFDHTSLIRFIERRFGVVEPNITKWRRAVTGDLTSAFDFTVSEPAVVSLPSTASYVPPDSVRHPDYVPVPPSSQAMPEQEHGIRPARALPYELNVVGAASPAEGTVRIEMGNTGRSAAVYQLRSGDGSSGPWTYTVGAGDKLFDTWTFGPGGQYDLSVYGPNGFLRRFKGSLGDEAANLLVSCAYEREPGITLEIHNRGVSNARVSVVDAYGRRPVSFSIEAGKRMTWHWSLEASFGWYDLTVQVDSDAGFLQRVAGHVETGRDSMTDPAMA
jgi:phospholipase C